MVKQNLSEQFKRMQKLAGILNENQSNLTQFDWRDNDFNFKWAERPLHPQDMLTNEEEGNTLSKEYFWQYDVIGTENNEPHSGQKHEDNTWTLYFDEGVISGFKEGEDFTISI